MNQSVSSNVRLIDKITMFLIGIINNTPYVIGIASAERVAESFKNPTYVGIILFANTFSGIFSRFLNNFLVAINLSYLISFFINIIIMISGLLFCAFAKVFWLTCIGVFFIGFSSNLGETIILCYITSKRKQILLGPWGSGTGMAGIAGAGYSLICSACNISIFWSFIGVAPVAVVYGLLFYLIIAKSPEEEIESKNQPDTPMLNSQSETDYQEDKLNGYDISILNGYKFLIFNCGAVYFLEYVIQGVFSHNCLSAEKAKTHRYMFSLLNLMYQIGVFISRSSISFFVFKKVWILTLFQLLFFILWLFQGLYHFMGMPFLISTMIIVGLFGGCSYVNIFHLIMNSQTLSTKQKEMVTSWNSFFIALFIVLSTAFTYVAEKTFMIPPKIE